jgi:hypothetical protein
MLWNLPKRSIIAAVCCLTIKKAAKTITRPKKINGYKIKEDKDIIKIEF